MPLLDPPPQRTVSPRIRLFAIALAASIGIASPTFSSAITPSHSPTITAEPLTEGRSLYEAGRFQDAVTILQAAVRHYGKAGDRLRQAMASSNLALVYREMGRLAAANAAIASSLEVLRGIETREAQKVLAQTLEISGNLGFDAGQTEPALETWRRAEAIYAGLNDSNGVVRTRIGQAQALQVLGFYRRSLSLLTDLRQTLQSGSDSIMQAVALRSLGDALQLAGDLDQSRSTLQQSLDIAEQLKSPEHISAALASLGNTARAQQKSVEAIAFYQRSAAVAPSSLARVQAQINEFSLLTGSGQATNARTLAAQIEAQLTQLPVGQASTYARIRFAQTLMKLGGREVGIGKREVAQSLAIAAQQAQSLGDKRAESSALGNLGALYEQAGQWSDAQEMTQRSLTLAQSLNAADLAYRWHWQLGRLLRQQGKVDGAIAAYDAAVKELQALRSDLVAVNREVQFSFRESVEPVYRESVELLLQSQGGKPSEPTLDKARQRIEALQLAELDDFFREACLNARTVLLDKVVDQDNPTAAVVYPIILPNELQVIVKIPKQPLRYHTIKKSRAEVEKVLTQLRRGLVEPDSAAEVRSLSRQVHSWLVQPIEADLQQAGVNTLVFVLDGSLRGVPMAALYDGKQYLVEKYAVALSLGLQLLTPKPLATEQLNVLAAGLVQPPPAFQRFPPLPEITAEFELIAKSGVSARQLLNGAFTSRALEQTVNAAPFNVVHLATHGQFSSQAKDTFILAADGPINVTELDSLLRSRGQTQTAAIELLVLSACQTAAGDNRATLGLAGVAVRAGARSTLASLWHISDRSTALFIGEFYKELANAKITKAEALRRAQVALLKNYPNYSRPGYWAPYVLIGNWL